MPIYEVNVKWGREKFDKVACNTDENPMEFKAQLYTLSGVHPSRQKVLFKGVTIKDDDWGSVKISDNAQFMLMGTADELPAAPVAKPMFIEDMTEHQLAQALELPVGLHNLGNTCYMNATLQCLRSVPELRDAMKQFRGSALAGGALQPDQSITAAMRDLFNGMESAGQSVPPIAMLHILHMCFPRFAEKGEQGGFQQQDANECWTELVRCLQRKLPPIGGPGSEGSSSQMAGAAVAESHRGFIDQYFGGELETTMKCVEAEEEEPTKSSETFYQLSCFIEKEVKYMQSGLKAGLEGQIEKNSPTLERSAVYNKQSRIKRLPGYLAVQMVRFFYKGREAVNAKILKDIKFPVSLDVFELCTPALQQRLIPARERFKEEEDRQLEIAQKEKGRVGEKVAKKADEGKTKQEPFSFPDDVGSNNSGYYELQAILTHKGRSSSSGHYVAWVRTKKPDEWLMFDDENVNAVTTEDILKLSGGGDWHCAYVLLYGPRILTISTEPAAPASPLDEPPPTTS